MPLMVTYVVLKLVRSEPFATFKLAVFSSLIVLASKSVVNFNSSYVNNCKVVFVSQCFIECTKQLENVGNSQKSVLSTMSSIRWS